jgi:heptosyltransferase-2
MADQFDLVINTDTDVRSSSLATLARGKEKRGFILDECGKIKALSDAAAEWFQMGLWDDLKRANRRSYPEIIYKIAGFNGPVHPLSLSLTDEEISRSKEHLASCGWRFERNPRVIGVNTGAGQRWKRKALPVGTIESVIKQILDDTTGVDIFLLGGPEEEERNLYLAEKFGDNVINTGTNNSLRNFAGIVSHTHVLLTADTMAMHIGMALGKYVVVHFGPTSPWEIDVMGNGVKLFPDLNCVCCYLPDCDLSPACNELISPREIVKSIQQGLEQ